MYVAGGLECVLTAQHRLYDVNNRRPTTTNETKMYSRASRMFSRSAMYYLSSTPLTMSLAAQRHARTHSSETKTFVSTLELFGDEREVSIARTQKASNFAFVR